MSIVYDLLEKYPIEEASNPRLNFRTVVLYTCNNYSWPLFSSTQLGNSPLSLANDRGLTDVAQMLIKKGATIHKMEKVWPLIHMKCDMNEGH